MNCAWEELNNMDARGRRLVRCARAGCTKSVRSSDPLDKIKSRCMASTDEIVSKPMPVLYGPGAELTAIFAAAGAKSDQCGGLCEKMARQMDTWGVSGCREHRAEIIERIKTAAYKTWVTDQIRIGWSISRESWFLATDPVGCIVDRAIFLAESRASSPGPT